MKKLWTLLVLFFSKNKTQFYFLLGIEISTRAYLGGNTVLGWSAPPLACTQEPASAQESMVSSSSCSPSVPWSVHCGATQSRRHGAEGRQSQCVEWKAGNPMWRMGCRQAKRHEDELPTAGCHSGPPPLSFPMDCMAHPDCLPPPCLCFQLLQVLNSSVLHGLWLLTDTIGPHVLAASYAGYTRAYFLGRAYIRRRCVNQAYFQDRSYLWGNSVALVVTMA